MAKLIGSVTAWAKSELEDCFGGIDIDCEGDFYLEENGSGGYVENTMIHGRGANIYGQLDVFGDTAHRVAMAIRIENANSIGDLPEGLSDEDEDIRSLAKEMLEELGAKEMLEKLGFKTGSRVPLKDINELLDSGEE